jgi:hypothetical protein
LKGWKAIQQGFSFACSGGSDGGINLFDTGDASHSMVSLFKFISLALPRVLPVGL